MHERGFNFVRHILQRHCNGISVRLRLRLRRLSSHCHIIRLNKCQHLRVVARSTSGRFCLFRLGFFHLLEVSRHELLRFPIYLPVTYIRRPNRDHIRSLLRNSVIIHARCLRARGVHGNINLLLFLFLRLAVIFFDVLPDIAHELFNNLYLQSIGIDCLDQRRSELFGIIGHLFVLVLDLDLDPFHLRLLMNDCFNFLLLGSVLDALKHCRD
jgi:hypothetical protein